MKKTPARKPKPITYLLIVQCVRPEIGIMAKYEASTPFPNFQKGGHLDLLDCFPTTWDVHDFVHRMSIDKDGTVYCSTLLLADSSVVENRGCVVRKQSGEEVGPSESRFRQAPSPEFIVGTVDLGIPGPAGKKRKKT